MMKFCVNHPHRFRRYKFAFMNGFFMFFVGLSIELLSAMNQVNERSVSNLVYQYIYFQSIPTISTILFATMKKESLAKLCMANDASKPKALNIDRTTSLKNTWSKGAYLDCKFTKDFTGVEIPSSVYDRWHSIFSVQSNGEAIVA
jgi:hypothetical protein